MTLHLSGRLAPLILSLVHLVYRSHFDKKKKNCSPVSPSPSPPTQTEFSFYLDLHFRTTVMYIFRRFPEIEKSDY